MHVIQKGKQINEHKKNISKNSIFLFSFLFIFLLRFQYVFMCNLVRLRLFEKFQAKNEKKE